MNQTPVQVRNAAARRLMVRRRYREALDVLNEAIRLDPRFAESYQNRAVVFEGLGMYPQADADRRKAAELGGVVRPQPPAEDATAQESAAPPPLPQPTGPPRYPLPPRRSGGTGAAIRALATVVITIGLFGAAGIGIFITLNTISDALNDDETTATPTGSAGGSETPAATGEGETPTPIAESPEEALQGSPLSYSRLQAAWSEKDIDTDDGDINTTVTGFATSPVDVKLSRDDSEMTVVVLLYDSPEAVGQDWNVGGSVTPKPGRAVPEGVIVWYNSNAVVIALDTDSSIYPDARDAFLGMSA